MRPKLLLKADWERVFDEAAQLGKAVEIAEEVAEFGTDVPLKRPGEPMEVAPCYVFLACTDSNYMTGQVLHPNGGEVVNG